MAQKNRDDGAGSRYLRVCSALAAHHTPAPPGKQAPHQIHRTTEDSDKGDAWAGSIKKVKPE